LNCCEHFRRGVGVGRSIEHRGRTIVGSPPQREVVTSVNTGVVEDDAAKGLGKLPGEKGDGVVAALDVDARTAGINSSAIRLGRFEFGTRPLRPRGNRQEAGAFPDERSVGSDRPTEFAP